MLRASLRSRNYRRLFGRYLLAFCVPMILSTVFFSAVVQEKYKAQLLTNMNSAFSNIVNVVDREMKRIDAISRELTQCVELTPYKISESPANWAAAINRLYTTTISDDLIYRVIYYPFENQEEIIFSQNSTYTLDTFFTRHSIYANWNKEEFIQDSTAATDTVYRVQDIISENGTTIPMISVLVPIPRYNYPYGVLLYQIRKKDLQRLLTLGDWYVGLYTANGDTIISSLPFQYDEYSPSGHSYEISDETVHGDKYLICSGYTADNEFQVVMALPSNKAMPQLTHLHMLWLILLCFLTLLGAFLTSVFTNKSYAPLKTLRAAMEAGQPIDDEISSAVNTIENLQKDNQALSKKLQQSSDDKKNAAFTSLLRGEFENLQDFNQVLSPLGITMRGNNFCIALLDQQSLPQEMLLSDMRSRLSPEYQVFPVQSTLRTEWIWLFCSNQTDEKSLFKAIQEFKLWLHATYGKNMMICLGATVHHTKNIFRSYLQARAAQDLRWIKGDNGVLLFSEMENMPSIQLNNYPREHMNELYDAVLRLDLPRALSSMDQIAQYISDETTSLFQARCICYDMVNTTFRAMQHHHVEVPIQELLPDLALSQKIDSLTGVSEIVCTLISYINHELPRTASEQVNQTTEAIQEYVREHFCESSFSIQSVCEHFHLSASNISHKFKNGTGLTLSAYLSRLRMERARNLLVTTDMSISEIAYSVGYMDASGFLKKFKQEVGVSPKTYRERGNVNETGTNNP